MQVMTPAPGCIIHKIPGSSLRYKVTTSALRGVTEKISQRVAPQGKVCTVQRGLNRKLKHQNTKEDLPSTLSGPACHDSVSPPQPSILFVLNDVSPITKTPFLKTVTMVCTTPSYRKGVFVCMPYWLHPHSGWFLFRAYRAQQTKAHKKTRIAVWWQCTSLLHAIFQSSFSAGNSVLTVSSSDMVIVTPAAFL